MRFLAGVAALVVVLVLVMTSNRLQPETPEAVPVEPRQADKALTLRPEALTEQSKEQAIADRFDIQTQQLIAGLISQNHYLQPDYQSVLQQSTSFGSIQEFLGSLDAYSRIVPNREILFAQMRGLTSRVGPGIDYLFYGSDVFVFPVYGGELYAKGLHTGVLLESINGRKLDAHNFESYSFLRDIQVNDAVALKVSTPFEPDVRSITVKARSYNNLPVRYYHSDDSMVLEVRQFATGYARLVKKAVEAASQAELFVIDLRFSPGGDIYAMSDWLSFLLPENQLIALLETKRYSTPTELKTLSGQLPLRTPIAILISRYTASSAEIFAHVLKSGLGGSVHLIGEPTKGKCLAQQSFAVNSEFSLVLSTNEVLLPDKQSCNGRPLSPEIEVEGIEFESIGEIITHVPRVNELKIH